MNILLCTLGASWAVIPEIFGYVAPGQLDLYALHPDKAHLDAMRARYDIQPPDELWVCTSEGKRTAESLQQLQSWWQLLGSPLPLRIWTAAGTDQLATQHECDHLRELTLRLVLQASETARETPGGQLVLSLAGGRKTMSADLQWAGSLFGAQAMLHVVGPEPMPEALTRQVTPQRFTQPLSAELAVAIQPLIVNRANRDEMLDIEIDGHTVNSRDFPLPAAGNGLDLACHWPAPSTAGNDSLSQHLQQRQQQGSQLFGNFIAHLASDEKHENWRSLYRLPPRQIEALRQKKLGPADQGWLQSLPKADLHRHLGGCLDLDQQRQIGHAVWQQLSPAEQAQARQHTADLLATTQWPWEWPGQLRQQPNRAAQVAALLCHASDSQLHNNLYTCTEPRLALRHGPHGFAAYERPGELTGSAILSHPAALEPYAAALLAQARAEGLTYLELRGSPHKYRQQHPASFVSELAAAIARAGGNRNTPDSPCIRFIWILDRRQQGELARIINAALPAIHDSNGFFVGFDLAGDEACSQPEQLAPSFIPAFRECLPITIHAGEGEAAENIWQAAYHLHADRIGHGLTLADHPELATRFRNRGIALELCPTSNREVIGYRDPMVPESANYPTYPLRDYIELGLPLTLCTDNPGISRTTLANEFITAARISPGGLSHWETLSLIKQGFTHSFLSASEREALLKQSDARIYQLLANQP